MKRAAMEANISHIVIRDDVHAFHAAAPPLVQTSLFTFDSFEEIKATYRGDLARPVYSRGLNPTVRQFEETLAALEQADDAIGFAGGMAAISSTILTFVFPGDRIVALRHIYPDACRFFETVLRRMNIRVAYVDGQDHDAVADALPRAKPFYFESPLSWVMKALDVPALTALARAQGVLSVIDNSWPPPVPESCRTGSRSGHPFGVEVSVGAFRCGRRRGGGGSRTY